MEGTSTHPSAQEDSDDDGTIYSTNTHSELHPYRTQVKTRSPTWGGGSNNGQATYQSALQIGGNRNGADSTTNSSYTGTAHNFKPNKKMYNKYKQYTQALKPNTRVITHLTPFYMQENVPDPQTIKSKEDTGNELLDEQTSDARTSVFSTYIPYDNKNHFFSDHTHRENGIGNERRVDMDEYHITMATIFEPTNRITTLSPQKKSDLSSTQQAEAEELVTPA